MEIFKEMDDANLEAIRQILNEWWNEENVPQETLKARVVLLFKKGHTSKMENYRPISLLNSIYKIYAAIIQKRLADKLDDQLQKTQYGFRRKRGTAQAIHCVRRLADIGESTGEMVLPVLLDWEKAFDKVTRDGLFSAIERMNVPQKLINVIRSLYDKPQFKVEVDGRTSEWKEQQTGIRQGCPLSPYLFLIVMTVLFHDVHEGDTQNLIKHRVPGARFDEIFYVDDTICISQSTRSMNKFLKSIEDEGSKCGLKLNKKKCELVHTGRTPHVHFQDGQKVPQMDEVKYLGCSINRWSNTTREVNKKVSECTATLQKLNTFWRHSSCPDRFKIRAQDAVIKSELLYGLESAQLIAANMEK
jgi:hypothetical protein